MAEQLHADIVPLPEVGARAPLPPPRRDGMPILGWVLAAVLLDTFKQYIRKRLA